MNAIQKPFSEEKGFCNNVLQMASISGFPRCG